MSILLWRGSNLLSVVMRPAGLAKAATPGCVITCHSTMPDGTITEHLCFEKFMCLFSFSSGLPQDRAVTQQQLPNTISLLIIHVQPEVVFQNLKSNIPSHLHYFLCAEMLCVAFEGNKFLKAQSQSNICIQFMSKRRFHANFYRSSLSSFLLFIFLDLFTARAVKVTELSFFPYQYQEWFHSQEHTSVIY